MSDTSNFFHEDLLLQSLRKKLQDSNLVIRKIGRSDLNLKGLHFVSAVTQVHVTYVAGNGQEKVLNMFTKYKSPENQGPGSSSWFSLKEIRFYDTILPAMHEFLRQNQGNNIVLDFPKCYYSKFDEVHDVVALEDLKESGFKMVPPSKEGLDMAHTKLCLKSLADFHSVSFAMIKKTGEPTLTQWPFLKEMHLAPEGRSKYNESCVNSFAVALTVFEGDDEHQETLQTLQKITDKVYDIGIQTVQNPGPFEVICHRDCWNNNWMFRYNSEEQPVQSMLLDMQIISFCSLTLDIVFYMFTSTNVEFRKKHTSHMLRYYYDIFASNLSTLGVSDIGFTFEEMVEDYWSRVAVILPFFPGHVALPMLSASDLAGLADGGDPEEALDKMIQSMPTNPLFKDKFKENFLALYEEIKNSVQIQQLKL